ncbi:DNA primase, partial [Clostridiaceae bacterium UIB06]|nr:DNA primase [Clostridiaceae bacterium UIB06]
YLVYNGSFWEESDPLSQEVVQEVAQELTTRQLAEAEVEIKKRLKEMEQNGAFEILAQMGAKKAVSAFNEVQAHSFELYEDAINYKKYAIKRRDSKYISSALKEVRPMVGITQNLLDENEFLLNAPGGTYDLRKGISESRKQEALDYITKQTAVDATDMGAKLWEDALDTFFCGDKDLIDYVQKIVGLSAIGKVYVEALIIAYGEGRMC